MEPMEPRLVVVDRPGPRIPRPVEDGAALAGVRLILLQPPPAKHLRDLRAWGDPFRDQTDVLMLRVCTEAAWYRMRSGGRNPERGEWQVYAADQLWVE